MTSLNSLIRDTLLLALALVVVLFTVRTGKAQNEGPRLLPVPTSSGGSPTIDDIDFPMLKVDITAVDARGIPITGLTSADFTAQDEGAAITGVLVEPHINPQQSISLLILLDMSEPVSNDFNGLKAAVTGIYEYLEPIDESGIIGFTLTADGSNINLQEISPRPGATHEIGFSSDEGALINLINSLTIEQGAGSPMYDALLKGVRLTKQDAKASHRAVVLVSDGRDSGSNVATESIVIGEAQALSIPIFTISHGEDLNHDALAAIADSSGGAYYAVNDSGEVAQSLAEIIAKLKQSYHLQLESQMTADNEVHELLLLARTEVGTAEGRLEYRAHYPLVPEIRSVFKRTDGGLVVLQPGQDVTGDLTLELGEIAARRQIATVNYFIDDNENASFSTNVAPWSFEWDTSVLEPGATHSLGIEVLDDAEPPHVGWMVIPVNVQACSLPCRTGQGAGLFAIALVIVLLLAAGVASVFFWQRRSRIGPAVPVGQATRPAYVAPAPRTSIEPVNWPAMDAAAETQIEEAVPGLRPAPAVAAGGADTFVIESAADTVTFLIDAVSGRAHRLHATTTIGRAPHSVLVLSAPDAAADEAVLRSTGPVYRLEAGLASSRVRVNERIANSQIMRDGDRLVIAGQHFVFRQIALEQD